MLQKRTLLNHRSRYIYKNSKACHIKNGKSGMVVKDEQWQCSTFIMARMCL